MKKAIMDRMPSTPDVNQDRLEQLRALMPDLFANDGALNPDELKRLLGHIPDSIVEFDAFHDARRARLKESIGKLLG